MTLLDQLHTSAAHREGFDPNCPKCLKEKGIPGIIKHLEYCAKQNELDAAFGDPEVKAIAAEQRRMIGILKLYQKWHATAKAKGEA